MADLVVGSNGEITVGKKKKKPNFIVDKKGNVQVNEKVKRETETVKVGGSTITQPKKEKKKKDSWFTSGAFSDGYQFGDVTKTIFGTGGDVLTNLGKGGFSIIEGLGDAVNYGVAGIADATGADQFADDLRKETSKSLTNKIFNPAEEFYDKSSVIGEKGDNVTQALGNVGGSLLTGAVGKLAGLGGKGVTLLVTGQTAISGYGSGTSQAYQGGATDKEAHLYGIINGASEAGTEMLFGGLGKTMGAVGFDTGLLGADDWLAKKIGGKISSELGRQFAEFGIKASAEGSEEVIAGLIQGFGKYYTYQTEQDGFSLQQILADEELLDQFIVGMVTSGIVQTPGLYKSTKAGRDFVTGYTQNEQKVVDREIQNRIAEAEADGTKLTSRQKSKIETEVKEDFEKGVISTDTIESELGGEAYSQLQEQRNRKKELQTEIDSLLNKKNSEITVAEIRHLEALEQELASMDTNTLENQLRSEMDGKIEKDNYLKNAYYQKAQRGRAFEYEVSEKDSEYKTVVYKSAVDAGANNTLRTHEMADTLAKLSEDRGVQYKFTSTKQLQELGLVPKGKTANGLYVVENDGKREVLVNLNSKKYLESVLVHETAHDFKTTDIKSYEELERLTKQYAEANGDYSRIYSEVVGMYKGVEGVNINDEVTARLLEDYLGNKDFINELSTKKPSIIKKFIDSIKNFYKRLKAGSPEARKVEKLRQDLEEAYKNAYRQTKVKGDTEVRTQHALAYFKNSNVSKDQLKRLKTASELRKEGYTKEDIWYRTGVEYNEQAKDISFYVDDLELNPDAEIRDGKTYKLSEVMKDGKLFETYPFLKDKEITIGDVIKIAKKEGKTAPSYLKEIEGIKGAVVENDNLLLNSTALDNIDQANNVLSHEIQHIIQKHEGYGTDETVYFVTDKDGNFYMKEASKGDSLLAYRRHPDEVEAEVTRVMNAMTKDQRHRYSPETLKKEILSYYDKHNNAPIKVNKFLAELESKPKVSYSLSTDNQGRTLTKEQQEQFKDSKVRDENGNLLTVYHGTRADFNVFEIGRAGQNYEGGWSQSGKGFYFTDNITEAEEFGEYSEGEGETNVKEVYLNITNPFDTSQENTSVLAEIGQEYGIEPYFTQRGDYLLRWFRNNDVNATEVLKKYGYDGIVDYGHYVAFESNQIKNVDNTKPTSSPDIRYSLSDEGTLVDNEGNDVVLEAGDTGTHGTLMAIHNLNESKMRGILDLGGFPVPSIAVTNPNLVNHKDFGNISVLFDKNTIDPSNRYNEVYDRDVWSPTFPQIDYEIEKNNSDKIAEVIGVEDWRLDDYAEESSSPEDLAYKLSRREEVVDKFVKDNNLTYETKYKETEIRREFNNKDSVKDFIISNDVVLVDLMENVELRQKYYELTELDGKLKKVIDDSFELWKIDRSELPRYLRPINDDIRTIKEGTTEVIDEYSTKQEKRNVALKNGLEEYLTKQVQPMFGEKGIRNDKEYLTPSGNRRSFWQLHDEYNLDNIVKNLTSQDTKGSQKFFGTGFGHIQSQMANQFKSIEDIKRAENRLVDMSETNEKLVEIRTNLEKDLNVLADKSGSDWGGMDLASELVVDFAKGKHDIASFRKLLKNYYQSFGGVTDADIQNIIDDLQTLKEIPTDYFEAKPQRAVGLDEVQALVIPNTTDTEFKQLLQDAGLKYYEYDPNVEGDRQRVINQFDDLKFSLSNESDIAPVSTDKQTSGQDLIIEETIENAIAPLQEEIAKLRESLQATIQEGETNSLVEADSNALNTGNEYAPLTEDDLPGFYAERDSAPIGEAPVETEVEQGNIPDLISMDSKSLRRLTRNMKQELGLNKTQTDELERIIQDFSLNEYATREDLFETIKENFSEQNLRYRNDDIAQVKRDLRNRRIKVPSEVKTDLKDEFYAIKQRTRGKLNLVNDGTPIDSVYQELSELYPAHFPSEINTEADQLIRLSEVANLDIVSTEKFVLPDDMTQELTDFIYDSVQDYKLIELSKMAEQQTKLPIDESLIPPIGDTEIGTEIGTEVVTEDIAPVRQTSEAIRPRPERVSTNNRMIRVSNTQQTTQPSVVESDVIQAPGLKERRWVSTSTESEVVNREVLPDDLDQNKIFYQPIPNTETLGKANTKIETLGYDQALAGFKSKIIDKKIELVDIAVGERLIQEAIKRGDTKTAGELIQDVAMLGTELGQKVQALSIIQRMTPAGQLKMLEKTINRGKIKEDKSFEGLELTQEMKDKILNTYKPDGTYDVQELNRVVEEVKNELASNMKVTAMEKINAWRYLSMLGNPKTHIRNLVSNVAMKATTKTKDMLARTIEGVTGIENRTKTWERSTDAVKEYARETTLEMKDVLSDDNRYSEETGIKQRRDTFKNRILNGVYNFNSDLLAKEDWWFSKGAFEKSFSEFLTANGIRTREDIANNPEIIEKAKNYATERSQIATFRQYSWLANKIRDIENKNVVTQVAVGSVLPFKKTPINIAKTGLAYSPLGFAKTLTYDIAQVKKGKMEASTLIDHIAQNTTGTALTLIGFMLARAGFLNGGGEDDKEGKYDYQLGKQAYSLNIGDKTYSLSWLSPVAIPMFVGANAYEQLVEGKEWNGDVVVETLAQTLDPLSEMSFLSGINTVLSSYDSGMEKFAGMFESMAQNYITQFVPTLSSQVASTLDDKKRTTKVAGDSDFKFVDETKNKLMYKIPGLRNLLEPSTDIWGNEIKQSDNILERAFDNFIAPYSAKENITSDVDLELKELYGEVGDNGLLPNVPYNYVNYGGEKYNMSASEYTDFKKQYGQTSYEMLEELFDTTTYKNASREDKADMVNRVYDYARDEAKKDYLAEEGVEYTNATKKKVPYYKENPIKGAIENDITVEEFDFSVKYPEKYDFLEKNNISYKEYDATEESRDAYNWAYKNQENYTLSKAVTSDIVEYRKYSSDLYDLKADKKANGKTVNGSRKAKVINYINSLDIDYGSRLILYKKEYTSDDTYNREIINYLMSRDDISYEETVTILTELDMKVDSKGNVRW